MILPHKDERVYGQEEANKTGRYSEFTICYCNLDKDHEHFNSQYEYHKADMANRLAAMQYGKPIPKRKTVPPYFAKLPVFTPQENEVKP